MRLKVLSLVLALMSVFCSCGTGEGPVTLRQSWKTAAHFAASHRDKWQKIWAAYEVPPEVAEAVIFPELVRYNFWQDMAEVTAVENGYVPRGIDGCDYSIGRFQMKPSFVEDLEKRWMRSSLAERYGLSFDTADTPETRQARFDRLSSEEGQCIYLAVYLKMLFLDYGSQDREGQVVQEGLDALPPAEQARLAGTAYNRGTLWRTPGAGSLDRLRSLAQEKKYHFPSLLGKGGRDYAYGDLSARYYTQTFQTSGKR